MKGTSCSKVDSEITLFHSCKKGSINKMSALTCVLFAIWSDYISSEIGWNNFALSKALYGTWYHYAVQ